MEVLREICHSPAKTALRAVSGLFWFLLTTIPHVLALESEGIGRWGGLNNSVDPVVIAPHQSQDCLNVDISINAASIKQRDGYVLTQQLTISTGPVLNLDYFKNSAGDVIKIATHDILVQKSVNGAPFETFITSAARNIMWDFEANGGYIYAVNSNRDTPWKYDGTTLSNIAAIPTGTQIEFSPERAIVADVAGNPNRVYFSAANDYTDWTVGVEEASPWFDEIGVGGEDITAIKYALGRLFVFKRNSITACFIDNQFTSYCTTINNGLGVKKTDFNAIIQYLNYLYFKGNDDYYYRTDGAIFEKISIPITEYLNSIVKGEERSNTQTTQAHWDAGTISNNGASPSLNTTITVGSIKGSTWTHVDTSSINFGAGTLVNLSTTQLSGSLQLTVDTSSRSLETWADGNYTADPAWTFGEGTNLYTVSSNKLYYGSNPIPTTGEGYLYLTTTTVDWGTWQIDSIFAGLYYQPGNACSATPGGANSLENGYNRNIQRYYFISDTTRPVTTSGYAVGIDCLNNGYGSCKFEIYKVTGGTRTVLVANTKNTTQGICYRGSPPVPQAYYSNSITCTNLRITISTGGILTATDDSGYCTLSASTTIGGASLYQIAYSSKIDSGSLNVIGDSYYGPINIPGSYTSSGTFTSAIFDTTFSTAIGGPLSFSETVPVGSTLAYSIRESTWNAAAGMGAWTLISTTTSGAFRIPSTKRYWQYKSEFSTDYSSQTPSIESVTLNSISTGTFISQCIQPDTDISAWGNFTGVMTSTVSGSGTYYSRSAATCAGLDAQSWTAQTNNVVVAVSTNLAYQFRWDSNIYTSTDTAQLDAVTISWKRGDTPAYSYGTYHGNALYWTITYSSGQINNRTLKYDLNFNEWFPFDIHMNSPINIDNTMYFGDSQAGKIYQYGNVDSDNNVAINSYWKSKDFTGNSPFIEKTYSTLSLIGKNQTTGTLELEYKTNGSTITTTTYDYTVYLSSGTGNLLRYNHRMPIGVYGTSFNIKFSNNAADEPWEMYNAIWTYEPKNWRVLP